LHIGLPNLSEAWSYQYRRAKKQQMGDRRLSADREPWLPGVASHVSRQPPSFLRLPLLGRRYLFISDDSFRVLTQTQTLAFLGRLREGLSILFGHLRQQPFGQQISLFPASESASQLSLTSSSESAAAFSSHYQDHSPQSAFAAAAAASAASFSAFAALLPTCALPLLGSLSCLGKSSLFFQLKNISS